MFPTSPGNLSSDRPWSGTCWGTNFKLPRGTLQGKLVHSFARITEPKKNDDDGYKTGQNLPLIPLLIDRFPPLRSLNMSLDFDSVTPSVPKWEADWNAAESRIKAHAATLESLDKDSESDVRAWIVRWVSFVVSAVSRSLCD